MGDFLGALFGGQNKTLDSTMGQMGGLAGYSTGVGEGNTTAASNYYQNILSGDPSKIGQTLAPQISAMQTQGQQQRAEAGQFGTRSGGTAGAIQGIDAGNRTNLINAIGGAQSGAAAGAAGLGTTNLGMAASNLNSQAQMSQQQMQNWMNSILGKGISGAVGAAEGMALGGMGGGMGAAGGMSEDAGGMMADMG